MLRDGRIIETGRLDRLRSLAAVHVRAVLNGPPPDMSNLADVTHVITDGDSIECDVAGSMEPLMRALAEVGICHLATREPSLEELFISRYGTTSATGQTVS
jgi:ABC-2 type transport system ATP-binding protein